MYEIFEQLLQKFGVTAYKVSKEAGVSQSMLSEWKRGSYTPKQDKLQKIADYFGVTVDYLMTGEENKTAKKTGLSARDEKDIAKDLDNIMEKLTNKEDGPASFDGEDMSEETAALFKDELERALRILKVINKEKYNPNKNKSR
ncbi:MAG: helix-turn-helix domain-containing protein [Anaerotignaceae bacterium]